MTFSVPTSANEYGFRTKPGGAHSSKSMMLPELRLLLAASSPETDYAELRRLVLEDNVLLKATLANRTDVFQRLSDLYGLRQDLLVYRSLRTLWEAGPQEQPILAVLCALARDSIFRATAESVLSQEVGAVVGPAMLAASIEAAFPDRYSAKTLLSMSQNATSSWVQTGHLVGNSRKVRTAVSAGPAAAAYTLLLGHLCGARGICLFETDWVRVLDAGPSAMEQLAFAASQRGWIDHRRIGSVVEIGFSQLLGDKQVG